MHIPMNDLAWQHCQVRGEIDRVVAQLLSDPACDGLAFVKDLEARFARYLGGSALAVGVQSGRAAEFLILQAYGIGPGDEVITVPNSDIATTAAISHTGARFVLVDIDPTTFNMDPAQLEAAITPRTRMIMPVHMYGLPAEMDDIRAIADRYGLKVVEDATLSLGAQYRGSRTGLLADAAFFSLAPSKVLGGTSNGGVVVTTDPDLAYRVRLLRGYGLEPELADTPVSERQSFTRHSHVAEGFNLKLDVMQAAIAGVKLTQVDVWGARRQAAADRYLEHFAEMPAGEAPYVPPHMRHAWRNYVVKVPHRDTVRERLRQNGIASGVLYIPPVHLQPVYSGLGLGPGSFPNAEAAAESLLCLPMHPGLSADQVDLVAGNLKEALA
jgi:dTDP-4-amino-4,6-dideoxygalactose transaminase